MSEFIVRFQNLTVQPRRTHTYNEPENTIVYIEVRGLSHDHRRVGTRLALTEADVRELIKAMLAAADGEDTEIYGLNPIPEEVTF